MIYLVKTSHYNEDFILLGYAVDLRGIEQIVRDYYHDAYTMGCPETIVVNYAANEIRVKATESWESDQIFYLVPVPQIEVK